MNSIDEKEQESRELIKMSEKASKKLEKPKKSFLLALLTSIMVAQLMFLNIATFLPLHTKKNH